MSKLIEEFWVWQDYDMIVYGGWEINKIEPLKIKYKNLEEDGSKDV